MKRLLLLLAALMLLALPALAQAPALPTPEGCTLTSGWTAESTAAYLMDRPDGTTVLAAYARTADGWQLTVSTPLPKHSSLAAEPTSDGSAALSMSLLTGAAAREYGTEVTVHIQLLDGTWRVTQLVLPEYTLYLRENGLLIANRWNCDAWYGTPTLTTDIAALDWASLPTTVEEGIAALDVTDWRYLSRDEQALRYVMDGTHAVNDMYRVGTPVRIERYSSDGTQALAAICGGETLVWLPTDALVSADTQFENHEYAGWHNSWSHTYLRVLKDATPPTLYAAPGGKPLHTLEAGTHHTLFLLGDCQEDGWFYVAEVEQSGMHGYVHIDDLPQDDVYVQAARLLPDYLCQSGSIGEGSMGFIMTNPQGETVFVGCELLPDETWRFTESQPMPEGGSCDTRHSGEGAFYFAFPDAEASALYGTDEWKEYQLHLHDGQWLLDTIYVWDWMELGESPVIYAQDVGMFYGSVTFDRNAATLDWAALPDTLEELLALTAQDWAILKEDAALCAAPGGEALYPYNLGTPVELLSREGEWAQVAVLGGEIRGWLPVSALAFGAEQIVTVEYTDWEGEPGCYQESLVDSAPRIDIPDSAILYDAPGGNALEEDYADPYLLLGVPAEGWYHVFDIYMDDCFVRAEDCDPLLVCAEKNFPGYTVLDGLMTGETAMLLLEDADGDSYFAAVTCEGELIYRTLSTPLPEGMSCRFIDSTPAHATLYFEHPALLEEAAAKNNPGYADCSFPIALQADYSWAIEYVSAGQDYLYFDESHVSSEFGRICWGEFLLSRDITEVDWLTFPLTVQEAAAHMDASDWAILSAEAPLYDAPDGTPFARYNAATPLLILDRRAGWAEVAVLGGSITGWVEMEHLIVGAAQADAKYLTPWDLPGLELGSQKDQIPVLLHPERDIVLTVLNGRSHTPLRVLGTWPGGWMHIYNSDLPGREGFIHEDDLAEVYEGRG